MPDFNADKEHGQGDIVYAVRNAHKGIPIKSLQTGKGELKLDKKGRCIVKDAALAAEIRKEYPHDLAVSRLFTNHPSDRGHTYFFAMKKEPMYKIFERWKSAPITTVSPEEAYDLGSSPDFYGFNNYVFDGMPSPVDGEIGYDDSRRARIVVERQPRDTEAQESREEAQDESPAEEKDKEV